MTVAIEFDFANRNCRTVSADVVSRPGCPDAFVWVDVNLDTSPSLADLAMRLQLGEPVVVFLTGGEAEPIVSAEPIETFELASADGIVVRCAMSERALVSARRGEPRWLRQAAARAEDDFRRFARSRGFLLFELGTALLRELRSTAQAATDDTGHLAERLVTAPTTLVFEQVGRVVRHLITLRRAATRAAGVLADLGTRRSAVVPETTQPHLQMLAARFDRLADDLAVQREILNDAVQMHLGAVSQRTNLIIQRLTIVGTIFLPLTFLTGVYGMNLAIPEARWPGMYAAFWVVCALITGVLLLLMRRSRWW